MSIIEDIKLIRRKEFKKYKKSVIKIYPNAKTKLFNGLYYVVDNQGNKIISNELLVNNASTVFEAWRSAALAIKCSQILDRNAHKFSDDKIYDSFIKKDKSEKEEFILDFANKKD